MSFSFDCKEVINFINVGDPQPETPLRFDSFELFPLRRLLLDNSKPVLIGNRAMSLLIALVDHPFQLIEKNQLMASAWPDAVVDENNLRAQIVALRRALGSKGPQYVVTVPRRGYRFVASVTRQLSDQKPPASVPANFGLSTSGVDIIGRCETIQTMGQQLLSQRFMVITGAGGTGKTTVALGVADAVSKEFRHGSYFIDLSIVSSVSDVPGLLESALREREISVTSQKNHGDRLTSSSLLLVLDNCDDLLEATVELTHELSSQFEGICVLATSRQAPSINDAQIHHLPPLTAPQIGSGLTADQALAFSSIRLFVQRVSAYDPGFRFGDEDVEKVSAICRALDNNPLAIDIAAARVRAFGIQALVELVAGDFRLQMGGRRTSLPRHRTLGDMLDWSYSKLTLPEQSLLRRLSVFAGSFTDSGAIAIANMSHMPNTEDQLARNLLDSLARKSLLNVVLENNLHRYQLSNTTRLYAGQKLRQHHEFGSTASRLAHFMLCRFREASARISHLSSPEWVAQYGVEKHNVHAALEWAYSPQGDLVLGLELTLLSIPLWLRMSLICECSHWVKKGLEERTASTDYFQRQRMLLLTASATLLLLTHGADQRTRRAWQQTLEDACALNDSAHRLTAMWGLWIVSCSANQYEQALGLVEQYSALVEREHFDNHRMLAQSMRGTTLFYMGNLTGARRHIQDALDIGALPDFELTDVYFDQYMGVRCQMAHIQLHEGQVEEALLSISQHVEEVVAFKCPITLLHTLCLRAMPIAIVALDDARAAYFLSILQNNALHHNFPAWDQLVRCFESVLLIRRGNAELGLPQLGEGLGELKALGDTPLYSLFRCEYAKGLALMGLNQQALETIEQTLHIVSKRQERWFIPELSRTKAHIMLADNLLTPLADVRTVLKLALAEAETQGAVLWKKAIVSDLSQLEITAHA